MFAAPEPTLSLDAVQKAPAKVVPVEGDAAEVKVVREWAGMVCRAKLVNEGKAPVKVKEVVLFDVPHALPPETHLYGEGFTMLSQTAGTLGKPLDLGRTDRDHYKIPQPSDATVVYGLLTLQPPGGAHAVLAFTSCRRFVGRFYVRPKSIQVVLDTEGLTLAPGQTWDLEEFQFGSGDDRNALLAAAGERIAKNHPRLKSEREPTGWCSWYCFGSHVKAEQVLANVDVMAKEAPGLRYVLIDDGYQPKMGDWLETGPAFGGGVQDVLKKVREKKFEAALWVAPFIAEKDSKLFKDHPEWFIRDDDGKPLASDKVTFGGWRCGPWYALDGTHPEAQKHLEALFHTLRKEWGVTCFKLDANFWGAMHGGKFHDPRATRVEAYRRGMEAIRRGAGDAFILGCNHPIWPSLGEIHGSRSSGDIKRTWPTFAGRARQNLNRNWQNGRLWWNDPDCVLLTGDLSAAEYQFHATSVYATGGMVLSGDDLTKISAPRLATLRKLLPPAGVPAEFEDDTLRVGHVRLKDRTVVCLLNWDEKPQTVTVKLPGPCRVTDYWTGESLGRHEGVFEVKDMPKHSGRLLVCEPVTPK
jgi:alpha-galactosidase